MLSQFVALKFIKKCIFHEDSHQKPMILLK